MKVLLIELYEVVVSQIVVARSVSLFSAEDSTTATTTASQSNQDVRSDEEPPHEVARLGEETSHVIVLSVLFNCLGTGIFTTADRTLSLPEPDLTGDEPGQVAEALECAEKSSNLVEAGRVLGSRGDHHQAGGDESDDHHDEAPFEPDNEVLRHIGVKCFLLC